MSLYSSAPSTPSAGTPAAGAERLRIEVMEAADIEELLSRPYVVLKLGKLYRRTSTNREDDTVWNEVFTLPVRPEDRLELCVRHDDSKGSRNFAVGFVRGQTLFDRRGTLFWVHLKDMSGNPSGKLLLSVRDGGVRRSSSKALTPAGDLQEQPQQQRSGRTSATSGGAAEEAENQPAPATSRPDFDRIFGKPESYVGIYSSAPLSTMHLGSQPPQTPLTPLHCASSLGGDSAVRGRALSLPSTHTVRPLRDYLPVTTTTTYTYPPMYQPSTSFMCQGFPAQPVVTPRQSYCCMTSPTHAALAPVTETRRVRYLSGTTPCHATPTTSTTIYHSSPAVISPMAARPIPTYLPLCTTPITSAAVALPSGPISAAAYTQHILSSYPANNPVRPATFPVASYVTPALTSAGSAFSTYVPTTAMASMTPAAVQVAPVAAVAPPPAVPQQQPPPQSWRSPASFQPNPVTQVF